MADNSTPNQNANKSKAEGERSRKDDEAGGITNRSYSEERENQEALPERGASRDESRTLGVGDEVEMDREERRSER